MKPGRLKRYRPKKRDRYTSKEYREFLSYISWKHFAAVWAEGMWNSSNRPGFMRRFLAAQSGKPLPKFVPVTTAQDAFKAEHRPYHRHASYAHLIEPGWREKQAAEWKERGILGKCYE